MKHAAISPAPEIFRPIFKIFAPESAMAHALRLGPVPPPILAAIAVDYTGLIRAAGRIAETGV